MLELDKTKGEKMTDPQDYELVIGLDENEEIITYIEDYTEEEVDE